MNSSESNVIQVFCFIESKQLIKELLIVMIVYIKHEENEQELLHVCLI